MRFVAAVLLACISTIAAAQANPVTQPTRLAPEWQQRTRAMLETAVEIPTVAHRGEMKRLADYLAGELRKGGWSADDIEILAHEGVPGDQTVTMIARWRAERPAARPILLLAHMDVVEAKREDWKEDPFEFIERDGYFYGRGTNDNKAGMVVLATTLLKLRQEGFRPNRDLVLVFTGDEETMGNGATLAAERLKGAEFALNSDAGNGAYLADGRPVGFGLQTSEKTFQTYHFTARNRGGHSSRPRPDNAIYDLADALKRLQAHRFAPILNETTRAYFTERAKQEGDSPLGRAMRAWVANPADGAAADAIEANEIEVGTTRTRCVATMLEGGHADNALPQMARATVNCRIMPGIEPVAVQSELQRVAGAAVEVAPDPTFIGVSTPTSPLRPDVVQAYRNAVHALHGSAMPVIPMMIPGATDGAFFRAAGIPTYGVDGAWVISPEDERAHGLDERIPVRAVYDNVVHWEILLRELAGGQ